MRNKIARLLLLLLGFGCFWNCTSNPYENDIADFRLYPMMYFFRFNGWPGMGDSITDYPPDSVLYYGLKVDGKSFEEVCKLYGPPADTLLYELHYGLEYGGHPYLYPLTYNKEDMLVKKASWNISSDNSDSIVMTLYFEIINAKSNAFYGYQFDSSKIIELMP